SSRPGRPPKRLQTEGATHHVLARGGLLHAGIMPPAGGPSTTTLADLSILAKKIKLETLAGYSSSHPQARPTAEDGEHSPGLAVLDQLPFMMMSHPLIPAGLAPASVSMAMGQMNRLSTLASMAKAAHLHAKPLSRAPTSVIRERVLDSPSPTPSLEDAHVSSNHSSSVSSSPSHVGPTAGPTREHQNEVRSFKALVGLSLPRPVPGTRTGDVHTHGSREGCDRQAFHKPPSGRQGCERRSQRPPAGLQQAPFIFPEGLSSMETLLTNIQQGLLRVAIENARAQEKQDQLERTELKMELVRERELRETLERQLSVEQKNRVLIQKRLKKEKRNKRRLQEALEEEVKLRDQAEHTLLHTASTHTGDTHRQHSLQDVPGRTACPHEGLTAVPEGRVFLQAAGMY
uniref:Dachshund c n=1 Tax=Tetraodon nigroviridis TaxID=99883 RepID=H3C7P8_TETNG